MRIFLVKGMPASSEGSHYPSRSCWKGIRQTACRVFQGCGGAKKVEWHATQNKILARLASDSERRDLYEDMIKELSGQLKKKGVAQDKVDEVVAGMRNLLKNLEKRPTHNKRMVNKLFQKEAEVEAAIWKVLSLTKAHEKKSCIDEPLRAAIGKVANYYAKSK